VSIHGIADQSGEAWAELAAWEPADPGDLFDLLIMLPDMLHDVAYGLARAAGTVSQTGIHQGAVDLLYAAANDIAHAGQYAAELDRLARI
jgi:hypothetical protein